MTQRSSQNGTVRPLFPVPASTTSLPSSSGPNTNGQVTYLSPQCIPRAKTHEKELRFIEDLVTTGRVNSEFEISYVRPSSKVKLEWNGKPSTILVVKVRYAKLHSRVTQPLSIEME